MKKLLLSVALCLCASAVSAQMIEIVHLKNGGQIRGTVTEQIPSEHLKIRTADGSVFVYSYDEIEKITKEPYKQKRRPAYRYERNGFEKERNRSASGFRPRYEGAVELGYSVGVSSVGGTGRVGLSTSHGCRVVPFLYVGAGAQADYYHSGPSYGIPIFADFRGYFTQQAVKPFLNFRIGYSVGDVDGFYFSPAVGVNFRMLDVSLGYTYQEADIFYTFFTGAYYDYLVVKRNIGAVNIKVGIRF